MCRFVRRKSGIYRLQFQNVKVRNQGLCHFRYLLSPAATDLLIFLSQRNKYLHARKEFESLNFTAYLAYLRSKHLYRRRNKLPLL